MKQQEKTEGIVLRSTEYREAQRILTLFTPHEGLITLLVKHLAGRNKNLIPLTSTLAHGEFLITQKGRDLWEVVEGSLYDGHFHLRYNLQHMEGAGYLARMVLTSQLPGKSAPALYALFLSYLNHIARTENPYALIVSFQLKLLRHEGILDIKPLCARCRSAKAQSLLHGESLCAEHAPPGGKIFSEEEWNTLLTLFHARSFSSLYPLEVNTEWIAWLYSLIP